MFEYFREGSNSDQLYIELGLSRNCTAQDITRAYRSLAKKLHPDKVGGDGVKFQQLTSAYEVLRDPAKRSMYDQFGERSLNQRSDVHSSSIFGRFFGRRQQNTRFVLKVEMEELYTGTTRSLSVSKPTPCQACEGSGGLQLVACSFCHGQGTSQFSRVVGQGCIQQTDRLCSTCKGTGKQPSNICVVCEGRKVTQMTSTLDVHIQPGMNSGEVLLFPEHEVSVQLLGLPHPRFTRKGNDLLYQHTITILESVEGVGFGLELLDGQVLYVQTTPGDILPHLCSRVLTGHGFPRGSLRGDLYIQFVVEWPETVDSVVIDKLRQLCPVKGLSDCTGAMSVIMDRTPVDVSSFLKEQDQPNQPGCRSQ